MSSQSPLLDLPVVDLSFLQSNPDGKSEALKTECCAKIREACEELGFFHVINHGIDPSLVQAADSIVRDMFALPAEWKERAASPLFYNGYVPSQGSMPESIFLPTVLLFDSIRGVADKLWPQGNPKFCETVHAYSCKVAHLAGAIVKLLVRSLDLDVSKYFESEFGECKGWMRMNYYHGGVNEDSNGELRTSTAHTDISCITVLYQDDVGGLQVRTKEGVWINVKPHPHSFVVNIGDAFKMWSNDTYRSAEHRVVYGGRRSRLSLAFFWDPPNEKEICAPEELIDKAHPRVYKAVSMKDYKEYYRQRGPGLKNAHDFVVQS